MRELPVASFIYRYLLSGIATTVVSPPKAKSALSGRAFRVAMSATTGIASKVFVTTELLSAHFIAIALTVVVASRVNGSAYAVLDAVGSLPSRV